MIESVLPCVQSRDDAQGGPSSAVRVDANAYLDYNYGNQEIPGRNSFSVLDLRETVGEGQLVAFRFKNATCVVAGTFNMYIVQPAWLAKIGIIPKGTEVAIGSKLDEPGFRFSSHKLRSQWIITPSRIEVATESTEEDCGAKVAAVLQALPWTPLAGLGNNAFFAAPLQEVESLPEEMRHAPKTPPGYDLTQRSFHFGASQDGRIFNLQLNITKDELELIVNVHTELRSRDSEVGQAAARRFLRDRKDAEALIGHYFKASIEYANNDAKPA